jgi:hypothetical protein
MHYSILFAIIDLMDWSSMWNNGIIVEKLDLVVQVQVQ